MADDEPRLALDASGHTIFDPPEGATQRRSLSTLEPGERPQYHAAYYSSFVLDPDGNNIEVVNHHR